MSILFWGALERKPTVLQSSRAIKVNSGLYATAPSVNCQNYNLEGIFSKYSQFWTEPFMKAGHWSFLDKVFMKNFLFGSSSHLSIKIFLAVIGMFWILSTFIPWLWLPGSTFACWQMQKDDFFIYDREGQLWQL